MDIIIKEKCPICGQQLKIYHTSKNQAERTITIYWDCHKCNKEFRSKYNIVLEKLEERTFIE